MSSYLLAISVQEFEFVERITETGLRFRVWSQPERINTTSYALNFAVKCLEFFEDYLEFKYPLDKLDLVALPDFFSSAMENWGLNNYKEDVLLYREDLHSLDDRYTIEFVIAHDAQFIISCAVHKQRLIIFNWKAIGIIPPPKDKLLQKSQALPPF
ncbi:hypothetical protein TELCIR_06966 [Teladorsagia circumcincta]|uniref:Peptidase M1 membrane alanine aminopeptidase domain-containing protein n=1 Tax=Teladorsagia circumcincta TaxID=45464 RepID=A0A2G9ULQ1_TELCI|nr:hypothetical protein TELCIR_06966 [Teladorsagia circumcincta]